MASGFRVTARELRDKANELRTLNTQLKSEIDKMEGQELSLVSMWEGDARDSFDQAFKSDKGQMDNFRALIEQYCQALEVIAARYSTAEERNVETTRTRTYH